MKKVLLVDDSPEIINNLTRIISEIKGLTIAATAANANTAIKEYKLHKPDIVILDIGLAKSSGIEVLAELKVEPKPPIVIMFTNYSRDSFRHTTVKMGADYFFDKTHDTERLIEILTILSKTRYHFM